MGESSNFSSHDTLLISTSKKLRYRQYRSSNRNALFRNQHRRTLSLPPWLYCLVDYAHWSLSLVGAVLEGAAGSLGVFLAGRALCGIGEGLWLSNVSV
jgi:hypothetical protein